MNATEQPEAQPSPFADETTESEELETPIEEAEDNVEEEAEETEESEEESSEEDDEEIDEDEDEVGDSEDYDDEELEELIEEILKEDGNEEGEQQQDVVPHAALHQEREKRKTVQAEMQQQIAYSNMLQTKVNELDQMLQGVKSQAKELGIEDVLSIGESQVNLPPELQQVMQQREQSAKQEQYQTMAQDISEEFHDRSLEFGVNTDDRQTSEAVFGLAFANMLLGQDVEAATENALKLQTSILNSAKKSVIRNRPVRASKSGAKATKPTTRKRRLNGVAKAVRSGKIPNDFFGNYFDQMTD